MNDAQSIWPAPDGTDAELVVRTQAVLEQTVILATPRVCRLRYTIKALEATMTLGENPPAPWPDVNRLPGEAFELMITDKGPMVVPAEGPKLPPRVASWLSSISENMRSLWPVPPENSKPGTTWQAMPKVPGGLPPNTRSAKVKIKYEVVDILGEEAELAVRFGLRAIVKAPNSQQPHTAEGRGQLSLKVQKRAGFLSGSRQGTMELIRPSQARNQLVRSRMTVQAE